MTFIKITWKDVCRESHEYKPTLMLLLTNKCLPETTSYPTSYYYY